MVLARVIADPAQHQDMTVSAAGLGNRQAQRAQEHQPQHGEEPADNALPTLE